MATDDHLLRVPGIREVSGFFSSFGGEDVVVRPDDADRDAFRIEVLFPDERTAVFPPSAPVRQGDRLERDDPRGGVIEYSIEKYELLKSPFNDNDDHWNAHLIKDGHVARQFAQPNIVINGGTNQFAVGDRNDLQFTNGTPNFPEVIAALESIRSDTPRDALLANEKRELDDALDDAVRAAQEAENPGAVKRALYGVKGVVSELGDSAHQGSLEGVKKWASVTTAVILSNLNTL